MKLTNLKVIVVSLVGGAVAGTAGGLLYAWLGDKVAFHGIGTGLFIVGILALGVGLTGAAEPEQGWSSKRAEGRRSMASRLISEEAVEISSKAMAVWAVTVGLPLVVLSMVAFSLAV
ncbi:MAG: hypothetical protein GEU71_14850 [Actinobacteria bacterium]|nr:hypothetical protein [Actinomycetota bacterium]